MKPYYPTHKKPIAQTILWLLPTAIEITIYILLALITLAISNIDFINEFLFIPQDFSLREAVLGSFEDLLAELIGQHAAATLVTGIFWGIVGMIVYVFLWLFGNFSTELSNNLALSKFMHPRGTDRYSPLKGLAYRLIFQFFISILIFVYLNLLFTVLLPTWTTRYLTSIQAWPNLSAILTFLWTLIAQIFALHIMTILFRLLLLRKRVFNFTED